MGAGKNGPHFWYRLKWIQMSVQMLAIEKLQMNQENKSKSKGQMKSSQTSEQFPNVSLKRNKCNFEKPARLTREEEGEGWHCLNSSLLSLMDLK